MTEAARHRLDHLPPAAARLGAIFARPRALAIVCIVALTGLGWLYLGMMTAGAGGIWDAICRPAMDAWGADSFLLIALMWGAMTLAMMLPSAAPMILTYAEIADTAAQKNQKVVSPFVLTAGYAAVWLGFAAAATIAQYALTRAALLNPGMGSVSGLFSGAIFIVAGVYQFSALKHACLRQCRAPFPFFFTRWQTTLRGVFKLGLQQGLFCLGCCWAMMLVMFAVGVMNVMWMAALGVLMTVEKMSATNRLTYAIGVLSIAAGAVLVVFSLVAHWPATVN